MPPNPPPHPDHLRHLLNTRLTVLQLRTELLQRQLERRDGLSAEDRAWLRAGLDQVLAATKALAKVVDDLS